MQESVETTVDLTTELGEGFAIDPGGIPIDVLQDITLPESGRRLHPRHVSERADEALIPLISSAYLACGLHSGDPVHLARLIPGLLQRNIRIGAHPSYPDMFNFAQHRIAMTKEEITACILYQFGALSALLKPHGEKIRYVKCHGALYFDVAAEDWACDALADAVRIFDPEIIIVTPAGTTTLPRLQTTGLRIARECFADRGYDRSGQILPRNHPDALLTSADQAVAQIISIMTEGLVKAFDGAMVPLEADTVCLHSDTPGAAEMGRDIIKGLQTAGIEIASFE
ncbi:5-oxoprolinase subunit PxpA [Roseovarius sp. 2305UL8-3]|uniref:5-oxoprolinase subunit PxpA n=1 Tax=Roseovarius conchicola TaxID=3121636 RepID=UPI003529937E